MKVVVSAAQSKKQDAEYIGDLGAVMDAAGFAVASQAAAMGAGYGRRVVVLAGAGNNGGDGYVAARHLARRGAQVTVHALGTPKTPEAAIAAAAWSNSGGATARFDDVRSCDLLIDGVFGVGFHGELPSSLSAWANAAPQILAVDVASGLDATSGVVAAGALAADRTVALSNAKLGHFFGDGPDVTGDLVIAPLGLPEADASMFWCEPADAPRPRRQRDAHKWSAGAVAVVGGSAGMTGAAILAAKAALAFGAGAVATFLPGGLAAEVDAAHPEIMTRGVGSGVAWAGVTASEVSLERFDAVVVGPGLGGQAERLVAGLLDRVDQPVVLDADGLNATQSAALRSRAAPTVITPHAGEFQRLAGTAAGWQEAVELAGEIGCGVLLKGANTIVAEAGALPWLVTSGGPELASVGTGDVLAGMIGALVARGLPPEIAARSAAYWHGVAGAELAATSSVTADEMVDIIRRFAN